MSNWVQGRVIEKRRWTEQLYSLRVDAPVQPFQAGQFTKLAMDIGGERVGRPYSYVNPPHEKPLEFYFISVPEGPLTNGMASLNEGDALWVEARAAGFFTLAEVPAAENLWLLSTGTALGVFLSILGTDEPWQRFANITLVHGVRTAEELSYRDNIRQFQERYPDQFRVVSFVSREDTEFAVRGRITHALQDGRLEDVAGVALDAGQSQVMVCGNPGMVRDSIHILEQRGMKKNRRREPGHITVEKYW